MKRWGTLGLLSLLLFGSGCALNECGQCSLCSCLAKPAEGTLDEAPPQVQNLLPQAQSQPLLQMPPELTRRAPLGAPIVAGRPADRQPQEDELGRLLKAMQIEHPALDTRWLPKFKSPESEPTAPGPIPPSLAPGESEPKKGPAETQPIQIINRPLQTDSTEMPAPSPAREPSGRGVRYSYCLPLPQMGDPRELPMIGVPTPGVEPAAALPDDESRRAAATFGEGASPRSAPSAIRFGMPNMLPSLPRDLPDFPEKGEAPASITPLVMRVPPARPAIMAALKARTRRPYFLGGPIARVSAVIKQVDPTERVVQKVAPVILELSPPDDLPDAILPFVIVQSPGRVSAAAAAALLEPVPQIIDFRSASENVPRRRADLGPPEFAGR